MADCVTASATAPTLLRPWTITRVPVNGGDIEDTGEELGAFVDGGVGIAKNPVYQACLEAFKFTGDFMPKETIVVSLGTGQTKVTKQQPTWILSWLGWVIGELLSEPAQQQTRLVKHVFARKIICSSRGVWLCAPCPLSREDEDAFVHGYERRDDRRCLL